MVEALETMKNTSNTDNLTYSLNISWVILRHC